MHELDPSLFAPESIPEDAERVAKAIAQLTEGMADWWEVGAAKVRSARARGDGPFPAAEKSQRARTIEIDGPASPLTLRIVAPSSSRGVYLHFHGGGWVLGAADQ